VKNALHAWRAFWFTPRSPIPIALYRIAFGLLVIADLVILKPEWLVWYGEKGFTTLATMRTLQPGLRLNVFLYLPHGDQWIVVFFWIFLLWAVLLTIGLFTRASSIVVFLCLNSIHLRNPYILNGGDTLLRVTGFFLMFAPAGAAISIDRLRRVWQGRESLTVTPRPPWAQRLIQIQVATVYLTTFLWKMTGDGWLTGRTLYYALRLSDLQRFPVHEITNSILLKVASVGVLIVESSFGILIWFKIFDSLFWPWVCASISPLNIR
jgi:hypothetical protein